MGTRIRWWRTVACALAGIALMPVWGCAPPMDSELAAATTSVTAPPTQPIPDQPSDSLGSQSRTSTLEGVSVAIVGDSLTLSAEQDIMDAFGDAAATVVEFDAVDGRRMVYGTDERPGGRAAIEAAKADMAVTPDVWVVALGTNDVAAQVTPDERAADMQSILEAADAPVVWIDVYVGAYVDESAAFAEQVRTASAQRSDLVAGDWFNAAIDSELLVDDQVHLTDVGKQRFADLMVDTVRRSQGRS